MNRFIEIIYGPEKIEDFENYIQGYQTYSRFGNSSKFTFIANDENLLSKYQGKICIMGFLTKNGKDLIPFLIYTNDCELAAKLDNILEAKRWEK